MITPDFPTPWQKKTIWAALTTLSVVGIGAIAVGLIWVMSLVLGFLQPILIPFAVAGVMAYLLDPVVTRIASWGTSRQRAVFAVFAMLVLLLAGILLWSWLWGIPGMLLAIPMMMVVKVVCDRVEGLQPIGNMLGE